MTFLVVVLSPPLNLTHLYYYCLCMLESNSHLLIVRPETSGALLL